MWDSLAVNMSSQEATFWSGISEITVVVAAVILVVGLVGEFPDSGRWLRTGWYTLSKCAVIAGVLFETLGGIGAFVTSSRLQALTDSAIQGQLSVQKEQQDKILALSARSWTKEQFDAIQTLKGTSVKDVAVIPEARCIECLTLAMHLELAFHMADMTFYSDFGQSEFVKGWTATGVVVYVPAGYDLSNNPMATALGRGALNPVFVPIQDSPAWPFKSNVWVVMVGERFPLFSKFPFEPGGSTGWTHAPLSK